MLAVKISLSQLLFLYVDNNVIFFKILLRQRETELLSDVRLILSEKFTNHTYVSTQHIWESVSF